MILYRLDVAGAYYGNESDAAFVLEYLGLGVQSHYFRLNRESDAESRRYAVSEFFMKSRAIADRV